jgi:hypothetical protein
LTACQAVCALIGCSDEPDSVSIIAPIYSDQCRFLSCSGQGQCTAGDVATGPVCHCATGYAGRQCEKCDTGFHRDFNDRCVPDKRCSQQAPDPCGVHGNCMDVDGAITCACSLGYEGPRCSLCIPGYEHDEYEDCVQKVLLNGRLVSIPTSCSGDTCHGRGQCRSVDEQIECDC